MPWRVIAIALSPAGIIEQNLITYAKGKNIDPLFWYNSGRTNSTVFNELIDTLNSSEVVNVYDLNGKLVKTIPK